MRAYSLTLRDKIYLFFHEDEEKRMNYLFPKVKKYHLRWFKENGIRIPLFFDIEKDLIREDNVHFMEDIELLNELEFNLRHEYIKIVRVEREE